jgi:GNAT superfamily N-acetyltransferase
MALDGIRIRPAEPADADAIARVQGVTWQAAYLGMLPHEILAAFGQAQGGAFWEHVLTKAPAESVLLAELGEQVVGFISAGPIRERIPGYNGEFYALYVLPEAQGCGIGTALAAHAARALIRHRWHGAAVWVLEDNHLGRRFYERLDGRPLGIAKPLAYRGTDYPLIREMAYGWPDLRRASWLVDAPNRR